VNQQPGRNPDAEFEGDDPDICVPLDYLALRNREALKAWRLRYYAVATHGQSAAAQTRTATRSPSDP
jgi:hypothetical protein